MSLEPLLRALHDAEHALAQHFEDVAAEHRAEHEVHHVARDLARWSLRHAEALAVFSGRGVGEHAVRRVPADGYPHAVLRRERRLCLLNDLRQVHLHATAVAVDWEMLSQAAQALRRPELQRLAADCRPETLRQTAWAQGQLTVLSPQLLTVAPGG
ncbi:hypothetical protein [Streptomyces lonarensis]|uniref:DUF2383 domain-containing protein n=1 Tax=Streptomyces lonarensis TaxID=700599 RepID=A0A7X6HZJ1_9ACTN|nr:hypothetical protein [Streptomyces lonarensis]NJQ06299.1 hypothetical protein [Streptomyces lonarensis]